MLTPLHFKGHSAARNSTDNITRADDAPVNLFTDALLPMRVAEFVKLHYESTRPKLSI